ncbi:hypothetical protein F3Y22_tig00110013pilonHSYRG00525 [Hibiscus syriacus]|uniref:glucan endo-1,3-beta-D-glucosidase n=1 Tax=Hibiscus syriacus TaxID=106335 RepID=A0A6A3BUJ9_HIBSY|nr:hypothetical protein F3Y22_tig00110013pilonHSYRG00525 [Hibiscus syriacus]
MNLGGLSPPSKTVMQLKALLVTPKVQPRFALALGKKYPTMKSRLRVYMDPTKSLISWATYVPFSMKMERLSTSYPFLNLYQNPGFLENYAFFDNDDSSSMDDHGVKYRSVLDANIDTLVAALKVAKFPDIPIIVGEVGWPTDALMDSLTIQWIFRRKGQNKSLVGGKNVPYMEKQWCVYYEDASDQKDLNVKVAWACNNTDCTTLVAGASCSGMGIKTNDSVAFNMYYQMSNQSKASCDFQGLAKIVKQDPSNGTRKLPIMIKSFQATPTSTSSLAR